MRVICLNGWGGKLNDRLIPWLKSADPDVFCLQEVVHTPASDIEWLTYRDDGMDLPQRSNFFTEISAALPEHGATFCPAAEGDLWHGETRYPSQWGLATFVRRSIPVIAQIQAFVHGGFSINGYGQHPRSRTAHAVRLFDPVRGHPIVVAHMHGLRDLDGKHDTPARRSQAERLKAMVETISQPEDPIVVCGDFNVLPDSETFGLLASLGLRELVTTGGFAGTRTSHYSKPNRFADYLLVNDRVEIARFDVVRDPEVSDHCPLVLETASSSQ